MLYAPGKASNTGGVATCGLEMGENAEGMGLPREGMRSTPPNNVQKPPLMPRPCDWLKPRARSIWYDRTATQ